MPTEVKPATSAVLDHIAGEARILADHHAMAMLAALEHQPGRLPDLQRQFRRQLVAVGQPANAVGAEIFARHVRQTSALLPEARQ